MQISSQNSAGKVVFYGWVPRNHPHLLGTNGSKSTLVTLSVKLSNIYRVSQKGVIVMKGK